MLSLNKSCKNRKVSLTIYCKYEYFDSVVQRAEDRRQKFYFCRFPSAVNVKLNLSIISLEFAFMLLIRSRSAKHLERLTYHTGPSPVPELSFLPVPYRLFSNREGLGTSL